VGTRDGHSGIWAVPGGPQPLSQKWVGVTDYKMSYFTFKRLQQFCLQYFVHKISDMGGKQNEMDLKLRLGVVGCCMIRDEARVWLHLAKVRYIIRPHLYFRLKSV